MDLFSVVSGNTSLTESVVVHELNQLFILGNSCYLYLDVLNVAQSLTLKEKVNPLKNFKEKASEEGPSYKNLLLSMVRLIHANPLLMLNVIELWVQLAILYDTQYLFCIQNQGKAGHEIQSSTLELINGLVSLVHQPNMADMAQEAMDALLVLHQPEKIEMWNPEAPINTFWDVR